MNKTFDLLIIGAGPAGCSAALSAAANGRRVALVDKSNFPRDKVCGDALSLDVTNQLLKLPGLNWQAFADDSNRISSKGVKIYNPKHDEISILLRGDTLETLGHTMPRYHFDNFMFQACADVDQITTFNGVSVNDAQRNDSGEWELKVGDELICSKLLLVANGANSSLRRKLMPHKLNKKHHAAGVRAYYTGVEGLQEDGIIELHFLESILPGYLWIFPMANGKSNVGLGVLSEEVSKKGLNLKAEMLKILESDTFKDRFKNATLDGKIEGYGLPLGAKRNPISGEGFMLLGDAANLIDPLSGEGIANAIRSGRFAADQVERCIGSNDTSAKAMKNYDKAIYKSTLTELKSSYYFQKIIKNRKMANWLLPKVLNNAFVQKQLVGEFNLNKIKLQMLNPFFWIKS